MATKRDLRVYVSQLKSLFRLTQRCTNTLAERRMPEKTPVEKGSNSYAVPGQHDMSSWKKVDARRFGITTSTISDASRLVLKILQNEGFEAYLVGGCVRDLILKRTPKDFDVITTANLKQIKGIFRIAYIVGRRFPICQVHMKGSVIEVSSFKKAATDGKEEAEIPFSKMPKGCTKKDFVRWRDCARRDFTINSMFYDPFGNAIYDYANAMDDLKLSKLQTLSPAHKSFTEDCARILRGLRIAARLGFSFSKETETAIRELSSSVTSLAVSRLMMEMNYMLSYGAAKPSLCLLQRFGVLKIMLPFQHAYLINHGGDPATTSSSMLMKLFSSLDTVVSCGQPCGCLLWISILAFHQALVTNPQPPLIAWTFSALLYYGNWNEALTVVRQHAFDKVNFEPEILKSFDHISDEDLAQKVSKFASIVQDSISILTTYESLHNAMVSKYPSSPRSEMVFVSRKFDEVGARVFDILVHNVQSTTNKRESCKINHILLEKGNMFEVRFVLGKIIMDTLCLGVVTDKDCERVNKRSISPSIVQRTLDPIKKQKLVDNERRLSQKLAPSPRKGPQKNTVLQEPTGLTPDPIKKEQKKVVKEGEVSRKLGSSARKKASGNTVLQEQNKVIKERKVTQKLAPSSRKRSQKNTVLQEQIRLAPEPIKKEQGEADQKHGSSAKKKASENTVVREEFELTLDKCIQKEQKKIIERNTSQKLSSLCEGKPGQKSKDDEKSVVKERKNVGLLSSLFK